MALNAYKSLLLSNSIQLSAKRCLSITSRLNSAASKLFSEEQIRQKEKVGRIEKIEIRYLGTPTDTTLVMNRLLSTPLDCAKHIGEKYCRNSALALLDNSVPWDMRRPLEDSCTLQLLNFKSQDPHIANKAFWKSCSLLLGAVLQKCFKPEAGLFLHSFPKPNIKSGSFVYDIALAKDGWKPPMQELRALSIEMIKLSQQDLPIERLDVTSAIALEMFSSNPHKREQIPSIAGHNNELITVYRVGDHVDISKGPLISSTGLLGKCTIAAVHELPKSTPDQLPLYRVQGVALPIGLNMNHFAYGILEDRAKKLNPAKLPNEPYEDGLAEQVA
ncbi:39S ribosomal protein L39, mitochondrial [Toxorhynchites rutilus septentrionalis]|uniref:39S ribosomal protein L39, mitochondrial n=1 Tax=Toxorhynchites rutilus septentrionalis TaxID=329112 RepID=UPI0024795D2D|nr:39S ribosomal protein L39, mitochondrial [Toxorhynchites rutilus septentrionalis]